MTTLFKNIALIGKYKSPEIAVPLLRLARFLERRGAAVMLDPLTAAHVAGASYRTLPLEEIGTIAELAIVVGGDGTMLNIARTLAPHHVALVGVNLGRLGFLTDISMDAMLDTIGAMLDGEYAEERRMLLAAQTASGGKIVFEALAFNDVTVAKGVKGSMIEFEVHIDGQFVYTQRSDGLIVATPTGSTAYALSAGGPILHPGLNAMALVPVCPHTLSARPITVGSDSVVEIRMHRAADARAHFDSHSHIELHENDTITVRRAPAAVRLLHPAGYNYYHMLREKLHWSEAL